MADKQVLTVYTYKKCGTCRKATGWLDAQGIPYREKAIRETPPTRTELMNMLKRYDGNVRKLFNTSGGDYKTLGLKSKLPEMSIDEAITLLGQNGNLVKRPFLLTSRGGAVGFDAEEWASMLSSGAKGTKDTA